MFNYSQNQQDLSTMKNVKTYVWIFSCFLLLIHAQSSMAQRRQGRTSVKVGATVGAPRVYHPVVARHAQVHYASHPRWGASVTTVPVGAMSVRYRRNPYYYHDGVYYSHRDNGYVVVRPTRGLRVTVLPSGYRTINFGPRNYYYYYGTYYTRDNSGYVVVEPPVGAVVDSLPDGYDVTNINGTEYYVLDGVYYAEVDAPEFADGVGFQVVDIRA
jgi:Family of unknown function (DUF6515)